MSAEFVSQSWVDDEDGGEADVGKRKGERREEMGMAPASDSRESGPTNLILLSTTS